MSFSQIRAKQNVFLLLTFNRLILLVQATCGMEPLHWRWEKVKMSPELSVLPVLQPLSSVSARAVAKVEVGTEEVDKVAAGVEVGKAEVAMVVATEVGETGVADRVVVKEAEAMAVVAKVEEEKVVEG